MSGIARSPRSKLVGGVVLGVLVIGAVVGAASLDGDDGGRADTAAVSTEERAPDAPTGSDDAEHGSSSGASSSASSGSGVAQQSREADSALDASGSGGAAEARPQEGSGGLDPDALGGEAPPSIGQSMIVKEATLEIEVGEDGIEEARREALGRVSAAEGFIRESSISETGATLTFKVPSSEFEAVLTDLRELGDVRREEVTGDDVSQEFVDLEARLRHWRAQEAVFLELMGEATSVSDTVQIRRELSVIQETIEQLEGRKRFLEERTSFSTVTVQLTEPDGAVPPPDGSEDEQSTLAEAWDRAVDAGLTVIGGTLIVLGALVPLAAVVGLPVGLLWMLSRRRRDDEASPPPAPAPTG